MMIKAFLSRLLFCTLTLSPLAALANGYKISYFVFLENKNDFRIPYLEPYAGTHRYGPYKARYFNEEDLYDYLSSHPKLKPVHNDIVEYVRKYDYLLNAISDTVGRRFIHQWITHRYTKMRIEVFYLPPNENPLDASCSDVMIQRTMGQLDLAVRSYIKPIKSDQNECRISELDFIKGLQELAIYMASQDRTSYKRIRILTEKFETIKKSLAP